MTLFDLYKPEVKIDKPIRLLEAFAGYGSQSMALRNLGADFEIHRCYEIDKYAIASYNAIHGTNFEPTDICKVKGVDMGIEDKERFTYLLTLFHAQIFLLPDVWRGWQKIQTQGQVYYGKLREYSKS